MIGSGEAVKQLREEAERAEHVGFCMGTYIASCWDCHSEMECLGLYLKEKKDEISV
jgi:hypothetical protein